MKKSEFFVFKASELDDPMVFNATPSTIQHLFNTPAFIKMHTIGKRAWLFQIRNQNGKDILATFHAVETAKGLAKSPARGTFGGFSASSNLDIFTLEDFYRQIEDVLREEGIQEIALTQAPSSHDQALFSMVFNLMLRQGYAINTHELNYQLAVDDTAFARKISNGNLYKLKKSLRDGLTARLLPEQLHEKAYQIICDNQLRKGYPVTMSLGGLAEMYQAFPEYTQFWGVFHNRVLVGASVCFIVTPTILYLFYWGFEAGMEHYSPNVLLADTIYAWCREHGIKLLDIGISSLNGEPNKGLILFKRRLGLQESLKLSFRKSLA